MSLRKASPNANVYANSSTPLKLTMEHFKPYNNNNPNHQQEEDPNNNTNNNNNDDDDDSQRGKKRAPPTSGVAAKLFQTMGLKPYNSYKEAPTQQQQQPIAVQQSQSTSSIPQQQPSLSNNTSSSKHQHQSSKLPPPFVMQATAIASLGGILFGYDMGVIAGALPQLSTAFDLNDQQQEVVVSILYLGGGLGAAVGGSLCDSVGRKSAILWTDIGFMVGATVLFTAPHLAAVCVGRVLVGFAVAVSGIADVSYLHEIAPKQWRGSIVSVNEACISLGFLFAFIVGEAFKAPTDSDNLHPPHGWRYMFGLGGVMAAIQFLGMWGMPESPVWLKDKGRLEECALALRQIHGRDISVGDNSNGNDEEDENYEGTELTTDHNHHQNSSSDDFHHHSHSQRPHTPPRSPEEVVVQIDSSYESLSPDRAATTTNSDSRNHFHASASLEYPDSTTVRGPALWIHKGRLLKYQIKEGIGHLRQVLQRYRRQVWIALFLSVTQQFCGQTNVLNYAPTILKAVVKQDHNDGQDDGGDDEVSGWSTLSIGLVKFIVTVLVIWKIESVGRRFMLLMGMGIIAFGLLLIAVAFSGSPVKNVASEEEDQDVVVVVQSGSGFYFALPGVLLVVSGYSMSFGPLTWLLTSELFPTDIRGRALGASTIITYLCASAVTYSFLTAQSLMGASTVFFIYMIITVAGLAFACVAIPDTGGKTMEEIDAELHHMPWWNKVGGGNRRLMRRQSQSSGGGSSSFDNNDPLSTSNPPRLLRPNSRNRSSGRLKEPELS